MASSATVHHHHHSTVDHAVIIQFFKSHIRSIVNMWTRDPHIATERRRDEQLSIALSVCIYTCIYN